MKHMIFIATLFLATVFGASDAVAQNASRFAWTYNVWTNSDRSYKQIRDKLDTQIKNGAKPDALLSRYGSLAQSSPTNPQAVFAWGYAAWKARKQFTDYEPQFQRIWRPRDAMGRVPDPKNYEWSRLRFLLESWAAPFSQYYVLGKRLLAHNPNDYDVKYYFVKVLANVGTESAKQEAIRYVREFMRANPKKISYYLNLGGVYESSWHLGRGRNSADGQQAIAIYRKYLTLAPANDPNRTGLKRTIAYMQRTEKKWRSR